MGLVTPHVIGHHVASIANIAEIVLGDIIWQLRLVEENLTALSAPLCHVAECVLDKKAIHCHIIANYLQACLARVLTIHYEVVLGFLGVVDRLRGLVRVKQCVVGAPEPEIVTHDMA